MRHTIVNADHGLNCPTEMSCPCSRSSIKSCLDEDGFCSATAGTGSTCTVPPALRPALCLLPSHPTQKQLAVQAAGKKARKDAEADKVYARYMPFNKLCKLHVHVALTTCI